MPGMLKSLALIAASCLAGLLLMEGALRVINWSRPPPYRYDFNIGTTHRPDVAGWVEEEDIVWFASNSHGVRGPETPIAKPPLVYRIIVLGDSFAEGNQVAYHERLSEVMERRLSQTCPLPGRRIEVINFGVSGFGTAREIQMFRHKAAAYGPDLVFLLFFFGNDLYNNVRALDPSDMIPYFVLKDGRPELDDSFQRNPAFLSKLRWSNPRNDLVARSRVLQVMQMSYERFMLARRAAGQADNSAVAQPFAERRFVAPPDGDALAAEAWAVSEAMLALLRDEAASRGAPLWMANVPHRFAVHPDQPLRLSEAARRAIPDFHYPERRLQSFAQANGIGYVELSEPLAAATAASGRSIEYFERIKRDGGHWNAYGHDLAGGLVADALCPAIGGRP